MSDERTPIVHSVEGAATDPSSHARRVPTGTPTSTGSNERRVTGAATLQKQVTTAITTVMFDQLADTGYARMSMEAIARKAGVGKAALYRRWPSKQAMVVDVVGAIMRGNLPRVPDTGSLVGDVHQFLDVIVTQVADARVRRIALDLLIETTRTPELAAGLRSVGAEPRRAAAAEIITRAIDRGELPAGIDRELGLDMLISPLLMRLFATEGHIDGGYLDRLTTAIVSGLETL